MKRHQMARVEGVTPAGEHHQVLHLRGGGEGYQKRPCAQCPWRVDAAGLFPPEAFLASAGTSYDASMEEFACHSSVKIVDAAEGEERSAPRTCAGFILRGSTHNMASRLTQIVRGMYRVTDGGHALHTNYRAMAVANGVPAEHPALVACRDDV
ncbi:DUF6283 family protein [Deinococcus sp. Leaf326]|uniref:DUF6283 family protein n=1 Tax=Deinococcus sp. Leaf326 TaxID=1736338 RepID=UPI0006F96859|nr:DUF6283 family protein [Deinococcus sp. Leaf326]KQR37789.1 hypothetical protein ASF71_15010 [Deinococcus sp. Leaf326]